MTEKGGANDIRKKCKNLILTDSLQQRRADPSTSLAAYASNRLETSDQLTMFHHALI
jgi:hypothetical protein